MENICMSNLTPNDHSAKIELLMIIVAMDHLELIDYLYTMEWIANHNTRLKYS